MQLDFGLQVKRLQKLGVILSPEEETCLYAAIPVVQYDFKLNNIQYFSRIATLKKSYQILIGVDETGTQQFICSPDCVKWTILPKLDQEEIAEIEKLGFDIASKVPLLGKLEKKLPKQTEEEKEDEKEEEEKEEPEDEEAKEENQENEEEKEEKDEEKKPQKAKKEKVEKLKPRKFNLQEKHRLSNILHYVYQQVQIVLLDAYTKSHGKQVLNTQFRGIIKPDMKNLALLQDYQQYLDDKIQLDQIKTLASEPNCLIYKGQFDVLNNCFLVRHIQFAGLLYYVFSNTLVWGCFYDGNGIAW